MDFTLNDAMGFIAEHWDTAAGLAASMFALTLFAGVLTRQEHKDHIALWLMGAESNQNWARGFVSLFDAVFGEKHNSLKCLARSAVASMLSVALIWLLMGEFASLGGRLESDLSLGGFLIAALVVNVIADYVSLLETRMLLGWLQKQRPVPVQIIVLIADLLISAAIIWLALLAYLNSPLNHGEVESFAEILGVFSIFSVLFYSTFLTSVWTWTYILSAWILRLVKRARLGSWLNVEGQPIVVLASVLAGTVFFGAVALGPVLKKGEDGVTLAERALCSIFKGRVCLDVAKLTASEQWALEFILLACEGGITEECLRRGTDIYNIRPTEAARLFASACAADDPRSCFGLGALYENGLGVERDYAKAAILYAKACDGGNARGCTNLGILHHNGRGIDRDYTKAARLYGEGCARGNAEGCTNLGVVHERGQGVDQDYQEAARLYGLGCGAGSSAGCTNLGFLHVMGLGMDRNYIEAARLFGKGCQDGSALGCSNLGLLHHSGLGMEQDLGEAARLYGMGCEGGSARGCTSLGYLHAHGLGTEEDNVKAARLYGRGCEAGDPLGCTNLGYLHAAGQGMPQDYGAAARYFSDGCSGGHPMGCSNLGALHEKGLGVEQDSEQALLLYHQACMLGGRAGCNAAARIANE